MEGSELYLETAKEIFSWQSNKKTYRHVCNDVFYPFVVSSNLARPTLLEMDNKRVNCWDDGNQWV